jgi:hypothetical protein
MELWDYCATQLKERQPCGSRWVGPLYLLIIGVLHLSATPANTWLYGQHSSV